MKKRFRNTFLIFLTAINFLAGQMKKKADLQINTGFDAISAMHSYYAGEKWYRNLSFSQETSFYGGDGKIEKTETWYEALQSPGKLLIKFNTKDSKNGVLFENKKIHIFRENAEPQHKAGIHDLLLTAFDVYFQDPAETCRLLDSLGYDLRTAREDFFAGRKMIVIGAAKGDTISNQIWIDKERLYLQRLIYRQGKNIQDVLFDDYKSFPSSKSGLNYQVATKVIFKQNHQLKMTETCSGIRFPSEWPADVFNPEKFNDVILD